MSRRTHNRHRIAVICRAATGLPHLTCLRWATEGLIDRYQPVPDADLPGQRAFEARLVLSLVDALRHEQVEGALLGFTASEPSREGLTLTLHPAMADRVLAAALPRRDMLYGGLRGVPGLRLTGSPGRWWLRGLLDGARVRLRHPDPFWRPVLPQGAPDLVHVWRQSPRHPHGSELPAHRPLRHGQDWLLSRALRRPRLVNGAGAAHGWANTYAHGSRGITIEWCCAMPASDMARLLVRSGLTAEAEGLPPTKRPQRENWSAYGLLELGEAVLTVRQGHCAERATASLRASS
ncbi:hypothetical protein [Streptomyces sp. NPDC097619]|uniref:hypothetical protein n=1 Tax=Streptomyces sp. NPDC097619 TaxID=3157228 RepID=UPI00331BEFEE